MQFKVPQDVQREDTIIGPLTMKQLIILAVGGGLTYGIYAVIAKNYEWPVWIVPTLFTGALTIALTFVKIHELTFMQYVSSFLAFSFMPKKRAWIKGSGDVIAPLFEAPKPSTTQKATDEKLQKQEEAKKNIDKLVQILDTQGMIGRPQS